MEATEKITEYIHKNPDWKGEIMQKIRDLILKTEPKIQEEKKWNSPVWSMNGMVCSISAFKKHVSLTFFKGSDLEKETDLFNSPAGSKNTRSIIWKENDAFNPEPVKELIKLAIKLNFENQ